MLISSVSPSASLSLGQKPCPNRQKTMPKTINHPFVGTSTFSTCNMTSCRRRIPRHTYLLGWRGIRGLQPRAMHQCPKQMSFSFCTRPTYANFESRWYPLCKNGSVLCKMCYYETNLIFIHAFFCTRLLNHSWLKTIWPAMVHSWNIFLSYHWFLFKYHKCTATFFSCRR